MSLLKNEQEYRQWFIQDFRKLINNDELILDPEDIEVDVMSVKPIGYPCIGCILSNSNPSDPQRVYFI